MRDALPKKPLLNESALINLDSKNGPGTHWVCYVKRGNNVFYFDSFGDLRPPKELIKYLGDSVNIQYNYQRVQKYNTFNCGHLCVEFLLNTQY